MTYRILYAGTDKIATSDPTDREDAARIASEMRERGFDVEIRDGEKLVAVYKDQIVVHDGYESESDAAQTQPYESYQSPGMNRVIDRLFGDTPGLAVHERRCIKEPMGCGTPFELCRAEFGAHRPCVGPKDHPGDHNAHDHYEGNMAVWTTFRDQASFDEWTMTGLCQSCQDELEAAGERLEQMADEA
jgi:hypothetical protein